MTFVLESLVALRFNCFGEPMICSVRFSFLWIEFQGVGAYGCTCISFGQGDRFANMSFGSPVNIISIKSKDFKIIEEYLKSIPYHCRILLLSRSKQESERPSELLFKLAHLKPFLA